MLWPIPHLLSETRVFRSSQANAPSAAGVRLPASAARIANCGLRPHAKLHLQPPSTDVSSLNNPGGNCGLTLSMPAGLTQRDQARADPLHWLLRIYYRCGRVRGRRAVTGCTKWGKLGLLPPAVRRWRWAWHEAHWVGAGRSEPAAGRRVGHGSSLAIAVFPRPASAPLPPVSWAQPPRPRHGVSSDSSVLALTAS